MSLNDNRCAQCGQRQDEDPKAKGSHAPMVHLATKGIHSTSEDVVSFHLDCMPFEIEEAHRELHGDAIDAAKDGKRGDELRRVIAAEGAKHLKSGRFGDVTKQEQEAMV